MAAGTQSTTHINGTSGGAAQPKIHLYTNHRCPYAHRAHIVLEELGLPFEETIIDLDTPRPQWRVHLLLTLWRCTDTDDERRYLDINPRGLVPAMKYSVPGVYEDEIITESGTVSQFLADSFPSPLLPSPREDPRAPLRRARMQWAIDTWNSKLSSQQMTLLKAPAAEKEAKVDECVAAIEKEFEPLLKDAGPFFGGSKELTFVESQLAPFVIRLYSFSKEGEFVPTSLAEKLDKLPGWGKWAKAVMERESVLKIWNEQKTMEGFKRKYGHVFEKC